MCEAIEYDRAEELFREMLDKCCERVVIGTLSWDPSRVLAELDPTAFQMGVLEYMDSLEEDRDDCDCDEDEG